MENIYNHEKQKHNHENMKKVFFISFARETFSMEKYAISSRAKINAIQSKTEINERKKNNIVFVVVDIAVIVAVVTRTEKNKSTYKHVHLFDPSSVSSNLYRHFG